MFTRSKMEMRTFLVILFSSFSPEVRPTVALPCPEWIGLLVSAFFFPLSNNFPNVYRSVNGDCYRHILKENRSWWLLVQWVKCHLMIENLTRSFVWSWFTQKINILLMYWSVFYKTEYYEFFLFFLLALFVYFFVFWIYCTVFWEIAVKHTANFKIYNFVMS